MKKIHETEYYLYNKKVKKDFSVLILSDLHFSKNTKDQKLKVLKNYVKEKRTDYIFMPGDFIDSTNSIVDVENKKRLLNWLKELAKESIILISLGGHDICKFDFKSGKWLYDYQKSFFKEISIINNLFLLDNKSYLDDNLYAAGITQNYNYYYKNEFVQKSIFHPLPENKDELIKDLKGIQKKLITNLPQDKINIGLIHSPVYLNDKDVTKLLKDFDYFISGHMHNGCVPPIIYELWRSKRGIIAPNRKFFENNERNTLKSNTDKIIVAGPITMFQECSRKFQLLNFLYPIYTIKLIFTNDTRYNKEKIVSKSHYLSQKLD